VQMHWTRQTPPNTHGRLRVADARSPRVAGLTGASRRKRHNAMSVACYRRAHDEHGPQERERNTCCRLPVAQVEGTHASVASRRGVCHGTRALDRRLLPRPPAAAACGQTCPRHRQGVSSRGESESETRARGSDRALDSNKISSPAEHASGRRTKQQGEGPGAPAPARGAPAPPAWHRTSSALPRTSRTVSTLVFNLIFFE